MQFSRWRFYSKYLSEAEILEELAKMQKKEKIEAGDWVRVIAGHSYRLIIGDIYKVLDTSCRFIYLHDSMYTWRRDRFEIVRKHDAPFRIGDKVASCLTNCETLILSDSHEAMDSACKTYYTLVEPVESIEYKKEKENMCISSKSKNEEYKLRYKQVKDFSVKDLEEAGACETAVLKILRETEANYSEVLDKSFWGGTREQYFDQDFNGEKGLVWLEEHGFIQKIEPEYIYAKDLEYGEYAYVLEGKGRTHLACKPYNTDKLISVLSPKLTWSDPYCRVQKVDSDKVRVMYYFED